MALSASNQVWPIKTFFNVIGLIGFFIFLASFAVVLLNTKYFASLAATEKVTPIAIKDSRGKIWFWATLALSSLFSGVCFNLVLDKVVKKQTIASFWPQTSTLSVGIWSALCGIFAVILMLLYYYMYGKKNGVSAVDRGVTLRAGTIWKTIALAVATVSAALGILFFADYFFKTDFRFYVIALRAFESPIALLALRFLPFFLVFYIINSIAINCFNYNEIGGKWGNISIVSLFNALGLIVYVIIQYGTFFATGKLAFFGTLGLSISGIWAYPAIFFLFISPFIARFIYNHTKNPYIGGIINAIVITVMLCANTSTVLG